MPSALLQAVRKLDNLERAWSVIRDNGRTSKSEAVRLELDEFAEDASHNLRSLKVRLQRNAFEFKGAKGIAIPKVDETGRRTGKIRPIVLAPVESRIVQRAILDVLVEVPALQPFVKMPFSFGGLRKEKQPPLPKGKRHLRSENLSAVPAAIKAVLDAIEQGRNYVASADIRAFFTRIPKSAVSAVVARAVNDSEFMAFFDQAIDVELANMAELKEHASSFPIEDIGVAQGNSLSPLLGNIILAGFDNVMNEGDCRCIRYIDDFIILAPSERAANARLRKATSLLNAMNMELSPEKSSKGSVSVKNSFDFLGINIAPGKIRPGTKAQNRFLESIDNAFTEGRRAFVAVRNGQSLPRSRSLLATLKRVDGMIDGWGKHYWFCNDDELFALLDTKIIQLVRQFLGSYRAIRSELSDARQHLLLGLTELSTIPREPFSYPKATAKQV